MKYLITLLNSKAIKALDWLLAFGFIFYGVYSFHLEGIQSSSGYLFSILGLLGLFFAYKRPSELVEKKLKNITSKK